MNSAGRNAMHYSTPESFRLLAVELISEQKRVTMLRLAAVAGDNYGKMTFRQKAVL